MKRKMEVSQISYLIDKVEDGCEDLTVGENDLLFQLEGCRSYFGLENVRKEM